MGEKECHLERIGVEEVPHLRKVLIGGGQPIRMVQLEKAVGQHPDLHGRAVGLIGTDNPMQREDLTPPVHFVGSTTMWSALTMKHCCVGTVQSGETSLARVDGKAVEPRVECTQGDFQAKVEEERAKASRGVRV